MNQTKKTESTRGADLRNKMIESEESGENFRSENQGADQRLANVGGQLSTTKGRSNLEQSKK